MRDSLALRGDSAGRVASFIFAGLVLIGFTALFVLLVRKLLRSGRSGELLEPSYDPGSVHGLPSARPLIREAAMLAEAGDYRGAFRCAYMASISHLDEVRALRFQRGRTNWEYLRDLRHGGHDRPHEALHPITSTFDRKFYGRETCDRQDYLDALAVYERISNEAAGMKRSQDIWVLIGLFLLLLIGTYFVVSPRKTTESKAPTTYNADLKGVKAFHTLLGRLGYRVDRLCKPYTRLPAGTRLLIVVEPGERKGATMGREIGKHEQLALADWVRTGGDVMFFSDRLEGIPWRFQDAGAYGKGRVYVFDSSAIINNKGMRNPANAVRIMDVIASRISKQDLILFDEYHHGFDESKPLAASVSRQVIISISILLVAGLLLAYSRGRRFGAVRSLPEGDARPGFEFVESVGRLYSRAHASDLAADILRDSFRRGLCLKLGLTADAPIDALDRRLTDDINTDTRHRIQDLLVNRQEGYRPSDSELLDMTREIHRLEKEMGIGSVES